MEQLCDLGKLPPFSEPQFLSPVKCQGLQVELDALPNVGVGGQDHKTINRAVKHRWKKFFSTFAFIPHH
jgi:hypothetical protein